MPEIIAPPGLEDVVAGETAICCVEQGKLLYRGYPISELAEKVCFEEVAHLLILGELPTKAQLDGFKAKLSGLFGLPAEVVDVIRRIPKGVPMMDVLRTGVSMAGHFEEKSKSQKVKKSKEDTLAAAPPSGGSLPPAAVAELQDRAMWLLTVAPQIIGARFRLLSGKEPVAPKSGLSHAAQILYLCHGAEPDALSEKTLDLTLVLYAEHDFNASTFTMRVIASTMSDMVSSMVGAIGSLKGPLHGGANEAALELISRFKTPQEADKWVRDALARKEKVMGFGHRVYKHGDHRAHILEREMRKLADLKGRQDLVAIYDAIKTPIVTKDKPIYPNVDFPCGLTYFLLGLPPDLYTPLFVCSRITGWTAHYIEQAGNNRLYRPLSRYTGPKERPVKAIGER